MVRFCNCVRAIITLSLLVVSPVVFAKSVSLKTIEVSLPSNYGTLQSEIHFDERDLEVALKVKKIIERDLIKVINYFQYAPSHVVHFNVDPYMRLTNGNAMVFPTPTINLYNFPPSNSEHLIVLEDWMRGLVFHEYTHVTHLHQTRGYLEFFRHVFGSVATLPAGIVPRWFTEGIAVWSESHLIDGGRLNNPLFRKELLIQFLRTEYCDTIDCLSNPGVYPGGQLAYWAGAHFMEYLEGKKPGTIKCMVQKNSHNIPFNLNYVFKQCADGKPQVLFAEFRENLIKEGSVSKDSEAWGEKINNAFGSDDLQKGVLVDGNTLYKVERDRQREALTSYDLQENVNMMVSQFRYPISDLSGITTIPSENSDNTKYLLIAFNEDMNFRGDNRVWKLVNAETLLLEGKLPFVHDPSYVIALGNNRYLTASFVDNKWVIERQRVEVDAKAPSDVEVIKQFTDEANITYFKKHGDRIFTKINRGEVGTALYLSDLTLESFYKIYESKEYYDFPVMSDSFFVLREKDDAQLVELNGEFRKFTITKMDKNTLKNVTFANVSDSRVVVLENRLKTKEMPQKESLDFLKKNSGKVNNITMTAAPLKDQPVTKSDVAIESFPKLRHMLPHYWFLASGSGENTTSIGAMTSFSDPMYMNNVMLSVLAYPDEKKAGGSLSALHRFSSISDLWSVNGFFNHEYSKTDFSSYLNTTTEWRLGTNYTFLWKRWTFIPGVYFGKTETEDFISNRNTTVLGFNTTLAYNAYSFDDYFQSLIFQMKLQNDHPNVGEDYMNLQSRLKMEGRFHERLVGGIKTSYGKLGKSGFRNGVLYGGGSGGISDSRWHEFYGLPYSNAYGNEIFTFRGYADWNFWYVYRGLGLVPFYLKEAHLLLGREMLRADRIILDNRVYRDESIHSFFAGPRLKMDLFYIVPAEIDLIFSLIQRPNGGTSNQVEFLINADVF